MNKSKIEWTDYTLNPIKGKCQKGCPYCYAKRMYDRFKWDSTVRYEEQELDKLERLPKPSKIFLCSTHEIFGEWIYHCWVQHIFATIRLYPQHIFQVLTKCPEYATELRIPLNVWMGVTITGAEDELEQARLIMELGNITAKVRFISFEPLLGEIDDDVVNAILTGEIDWVIVGARTQPLRLPKLEWVNDIIACCDNNVPLFLKNNLKLLMGNNLRQEFPNE